MDKQHQVVEPDQGEAETKEHEEISATMAAGPGQGARGHPQAQAAQARRQERSLQTPSAPAIAQEGRAPCTEEPLAADKKFDAERERAARQPRRSVERRRRGRNFPNPMNMDVKAAERRTS